MSHDPFADPEPLIRRVYSYVAYRVGHGPDAEDITSSAIERALRYRASFDPRKGKPQSWLIGIARACVDDFLSSRTVPATDVPEQAVTHEPEGDILLRLSVSAAIEALEDFDKDLIALRYGADLSARQIGQLLDMKTNAVDVALHRARGRLRQHLEDVGVEGARSSAVTVAGPAAEPSA